ncbi:MAG: hypothetical protein JXQ87_16190 [Bacteroidia bacterium]
MKRIILLLFGLVILGGIIFLFWPKTQGSEASNTKAKNEIKVITGLKTCEICGYDAIEKRQNPCLNCGLSLNDSIINEEGLDKQSFLVMKQIELYMPDTLGKEIDFLNPRVSSKGYPKNTNWRPSVSEYEIFEFQKMILKIEAKTDSAQLN